MKKSKVPSKSTIPISAREGIYRDLIQVLCEYAPDSPAYTVVSIYGVFRNNLLKLLKQVEKEQGTKAGPTIRAIMHKFPDWIE